MVTHQLSRADQPSFLSTALQRENYLNGGRAKSKDLVTGSLRVAVHVEEDVDPVLVDPVGRLPVAGHRREVNEVLALSADLLPEGGVVIRSQAATNSDKMLHDSSSLKNNEPL